VLNDVRLAADLGLLYLISQIHALLCKNVYLVSYILSEQTVLVKKKKEKKKKE